MLVAAAVIALWIAIGYEIATRTISYIVRENGSVVEFSRERYPDKTRQNIDHFGEERFERILRRGFKAILILAWPIYLVRMIWTAITG